MPIHDKPLDIALVTPYALDKRGGVNANVIATQRAYKELGHNATIVGPSSTVPPIEDILVTGSFNIKRLYHSSIPIIQPCKEAIIRITFLYRGAG